MRSLNILFVTLEFSAGTFSGNGIYGRSQVRALAAAGHNVFVLCGKPEDHEGDIVTEGAAVVKALPLGTWGCLDRKSGWEQFAALAGGADVAAAVAAFEPAVAMCVDWSALGAYAAVTSAAAARAPPYVYLNYRVYLRTAGEDGDFIRAREGAAISGSAATVVLSRSDKDYMMEHYGEELARAGLVPEVLLPALRNDMERLPLPTDSERTFLTCCVRLSEEKEPARFVQVASALHARGVLAELGVTPLVAGGGAGEYPDQLRKQLTTAVPGTVIRSEFLGPQALADLLSQTRLNFHPPGYDAYGMTVVEAASQGAPSIIQQGGAVGAGDLLRAAKGEVIELDLTGDQEALVDAVEAILRDTARLGAVGRAGARRAREWGESANIAKLMQLTMSALADRSGSCAA